MLDFLAQLTDFDVTSENLVKEPNLAFALQKAEKKLRDATGTDILFLFPSGSVLNLDLIAKIAGVEVNKATIPLLISDIDILMLTDNLSDYSQQEALSQTAEHYNPVINRFLLSTIGKELCEVYNLTLFPSEFSNPKVFIPTIGEEIRDNVSVLREGIRRAVGGLKLIKLSGRGNYDDKFRETLNSAYDMAKETYDNNEFRELLAEEVSSQLGISIAPDELINYQGNILHRIAEEFEKVNPYMVKTKHIQRALKIRFNRNPSPTEVSEIHHELSDKGYPLQPLPEN